MLKYYNNIYVDPESFGGNLIASNGPDEHFLDPSSGVVSNIEDTIMTERGKEVAIIEAKRDTKNIKFGLSLPNKITMVNINHLTNREKGLSPYPLLNKEGRLLMKSSLEKCGLIQPLIVTKIDETTYKIIDGENRAVCLSEMFDETGGLRFENIPCIVLDDAEYNSLDFKEICINANLNRKCDGVTQKKLILMMHGIYRARYTRLKEINVAREISGKLGIAMSTVYNYLKLQNLCILAQDFLNTGRIDLTSAGKLARLDQNLQMLIFEEIGMRNISDHFIKGAVHKNTNMKNYKAQVRNVFSWRHPHKYSIKISGNYREMEMIEEMLTKYFEKNIFMLRKKAKMKVSGKCFDFSTGLACLGERKVIIPQFFQEFIKNGEIGEVIPDSHFSNLKKYKNKEVVVKKDTVTLKKEDLLKHSENLDNSKSLASETVEEVKEVQEEMNETVIDYNDFFKDKKPFDN